MEPRGDRAVIYNLQNYISFQVLRFNVRQKCVIGWPIIKMDLLIPKKIISFKRTEETNSHA